MRKSTALPLTDCAPLRCIIVCRCSFIMAADYWQERFHGSNVAMDMTMIYIIVAFATVLLNNIFLTLVPYRVRVATGERRGVGCVTVMGK